MRPRSLRNEGGLTLIEVMVAALVVVIGMLGLASVLIGGQNQSSSNTREAQLMNVADQQIEQVRAEVQADGFDELAMSAAPTAIPTPTTVPGGNTWANPAAFVEPASTGGAGTCGTVGYGFEIAANYDDISTASPGSTPYSSAPPGFVQWAGCPTDVEPLEVIAPVSGSWPVIVQTMNGTTSECGASTSSASNVAADATPTSASITSPCTVSLSNGSFHSTVTVYTFVTDTYVGDDAGVPCSNPGTPLCPCVATSSVGCAQQTPAAPTLEGCSSAGFPASTTTSTPYSTICADARRVTVAVVPSGALQAGRVSPVYLSTVFTDPIVSQDQQNAVGLVLGAGL